MRLFLPQYGSESDSKALIRIPAGNRSQVVHPAEGPYTDQAIAKGRFYLQLQQNNCSLNVSTLLPSYPLNHYPKLNVLRKQIRSKVSQAKTQLVLWIFIFFKVTR